MHEYSIVQALLDRVEQEARRHGAVRVERLRVRLGELSGVEADLLAKAFETFRERTLCAGAELDLETVPASWVCPACGQPLARGAALTCPSCAVPARLAAGDEIVLARIEMETWSPTEVEQCARAAAAATPRSSP